LQDLCAQYSLDSPLARSLLNANDGILVRSLHTLLQVPRQADAAVRILDSVVLPIIVKNSEDVVFSSAALGHLRAAAPAYSALLTQRSLSGALAGAKLIQALAKHGQLIPLLGDSDEVITSFLSLLFTHKWANVLHEVVTATLLHALQQSDTFTLVRILRSGLVARTVNALRSEEPSGNRGHLLLLANALKDSMLPEVQDALAADSEWMAWQPGLVDLNAKNVSFRQMGEQDPQSTPSIEMPSRTVTITMTSGDLAAKRLVFPTATPASSPDVQAKMPHLPDSSPLQDTSSSTSVPSISSVSAESSTSSSNANESLINNGIDDGTYQKEEEGTQNPSKEEEGTQNPSNLTNSNSAAATGPPLSDAVPSQSPIDSAGDASASQ